MKNSTNNSMNSCKNSSENCKSSKASTSKNSKNCKDKSSMKDSMDNSDKPPAYDYYPTSMRIRSDPNTNAVIPSDEAVSDVKRWADFNAK